MSDNALIREYPVSLTPSRRRALLSRLHLTDSGCWEWQGARDGRGYGRFYIDVPGRRSRWAVHRLVFSIFNGPVDPRMVLDHLCRNPACAAPAHLEAVTARENTRRGTGPTALNATKTTCKHGHDLTDENVYRVGSRRQCRTCKAFLDAKYKESHAAALREKALARYHANKKVTTNA